METPQLFLQLYSLRREMAVDPEATLRQIPGLGFDGVELAGDYGWSLAKWQELLRETGLDVVGAHVGLDALENDLPAVSAFQRGLQNSRCVVPSIPPEWRTAEGFHSVATRLTHVGRLLREEGLALLYHNHDFEFQECEAGARGIDILLSETEAPNVQFEFDTFWLERGGEDAREFLEAHAERAGMVHAKDLRRSDGEEVPAGQGDIDFASILAMAKRRSWPIVLEFEGADALEKTRMGAASLRALI